MTDNAMWKGITAGNSTLVQVGFKWLIEHSTSYQHLCLVDSLSLRFLHLHQSAKRWQQG